MPTGVYIRHPISEETRKKLSLSKLGNKNPRFGAKPWNRGISGLYKLTQEHKNKISMANKGKNCWTKGKKLTPEHRIKIGLKIRGKNNPNWKGGITEMNKIIRERIEYKLWREAVFKRDNYTCIWCNQIGGNLEADHIKPFSLFPELRLAIDNGRTLCRKCHKTTDTFGNKIINYKKNN